MYFQDIHGQAGSRPGNNITNFIMKGVGHRGLK